MEDKSVLIQCDEMTKNIMSELQDDMIESLSKVSKTMTSEVIERIKPMEKKINDLKRGLDDFFEDNEEFQDILETLNGDMDKITNEIKRVIESSIIKVISEQSKNLIEHSKILNENLNKLMEDTKKIKENFEISNTIIHEELKKLDLKIDNMTFEKLEDKLAILGMKVVKDSNKNKNEILEKIENIKIGEIENKINKIGYEIESNFFSTKQSIFEKVNDISDKINEKETLMKIISGYENELSEKIKSIQEELEWSNRSFFSKIFGKKRE